MHYYILVNEWNYPTESSREIIGDFDDLQDAEYHAKDECEREFDNFQEVCKDYLEMALAISMMVTLQDMLCILLKMKAWTSSLGL